MKSNRTEKIRRRYGRIAGIYDLVETPMEYVLSRWRRVLIREVDGKVLEVGVGTGKNLACYPEDVQITAIDFSPEMIEKARRKVNQIGRSGWR